MKPKNPTPPPAIGFWNLTPPPALDIWNLSTYRPGDGDVITATRPGSLDALAPPSRFGDERRYRDGRVEVAK